MLAAALVVVLLAGLVWLAWPAGTPFTRTAATITVASGPDGGEQVPLDTTFYLPDGASAASRAPAVLLAHGFGGTKDSVRDDAEDLARQGYAVLTWTARGFGRSGGRIHLNDPDHEVRDAQRLLDWLAARPEVRRDAAGDPRVGVVGGSYGGGLALALAGVDRRVDAIVPLITWNDLPGAFLPNAAGGPPAAGVFKKAWASLFFGRGGGPTGGGTGGASGTDGDGGAPGGDAPGGLTGIGGPAGAAGDPACGRFAADVCAAYQRIARAGEADAATLARLRRANPDVRAIRAPTLLIQGETDTLFPLGEADANARGIAATGTPVRVAWFTGGHDGGDGPTSDRDRVRALTGQWLGHYVSGELGRPENSFTYSRVAGFAVGERGLVASGYAVDYYPGLAGTDRRELPLAGDPQRIANPPGGAPAAISALPGAGALSALAAAGIGAEMPGQHADFGSAELTEPLDLAGAPTITLRAASPTGSATLFVKLYDVPPGGTPTLPGGQAAPVRLTGLPADIGAARPVTVTLPGLVHRFEAGHRIRLTVATTDQAYATPADPAVYTVGLGDAPLVLPDAPGTEIPTGAAVWRWALLGLLVLVALGVLAGVLLGRRRHRRTDVAVDPDHADTPLVVRGLRKEYPGGFVAVDRVDFTVGRGQVVGLLGPNGAGKTTTLRVLMGLTRPTAGDALVFGHTLAPGAPVLSRIGSLVEGPGFLPHLSGVANLRAYWAATGRAEDEAHFAEALEIAGLGDSVHRRVRTYSHGMKQRLAIAQAMLGLPELLVLDEPTDGLDPPQIAAMRQVLRRYAADGRAVLVSSHLLAEVEQTCTHVIVVNKGAVVASGPVADIVGDSPTTQFGVADARAAAKIIGDMVGVVSLDPDDIGGLVVDLGTVPRGAAVAALVRAGIRVDRVVPRRRLEDAFLSLVGEQTRGSGDR
ncbi:ABC transporter ATP-binding protein [Pilimelia anulata]|uniref:ABC transporter ATP-binding protein n=1 Tax=Pilimelia anulata TaxID=53371 RepID=A0A8J3F8Z1_9ACTN|nr:ABC transporter ATP-binding protein [Pilimelia anulata]